MENFYSKVFSGGGLVYDYGITRPLAQRETTSTTSQDNPRLGRRKTPLLISLFSSLHAEDIDLTQIPI